MKVKYGQIVGVNSTQGHVEILYRPAGSDESDRPEVIHISPHDDRLYMTFSFGGERDLSVKPGMIGANHAQIDYVKES
jgi:hypothetical protein